MSIKNNCLKQTKKELSINTNGYVISQFKIKYLINEAKNMEIKYINSYYADELIKKKIILDCEQKWKNILKNSLHDLIYNGYEYCIAILSSMLMFKSSYEDYINHPIKYSYNNREYLATKRAKLIDNSHTLEDLKKKW